MEQHALMSPPISGPELTACFKRVYECAGI